MYKKSERYSQKDIPRIAKQLQGLIGRYPIITFSGSLGTGKTTLIQELLRLCGVQERVTSPTFAYLNQYKNAKNHTFYHFDLYRINNLNDFCAAGFDEYLYAPGSTTLIEWPEHIRPLLQEKVCEVQLDYDNDPAMRRIAVECRDEKKGA